MSPIPYDKLHNIAFAGKSFYLTGRFQNGTKEELGKAIGARGGEIQKRIRKHNLDYLVVGAKGNKQYVNNISEHNGTIGRNIEKVLKCKEEGRAIAIVPETQFVEDLQKRG